ncbi:MAG TPA: SPOR domain-containing protein [Vicinamibacterales bacterium]|nr:SPOR domain-containing protein [Acidobacteriota bacterium]HOC17428.1 SPOR domain-containing protein [Vicinamibacterales bacterium]
MSDEGFQEIHLGNKQLVFLAMTGCVVLVVAFLFGVLVGRGARAQEPAATMEVQADAEVTPPGHAADPAPVNASPSAAPLSVPEPIDDELSYPKRLEDGGPANDTLAAAKTSAPPPAPAAAPPSTAPAPAKPAAAPADKALAEPPGQGYAVQIVALRDRAKAEAVARRLAGKGHRAYLVAPGARGSAMYRVVVGKFKSRQEAEQVKRRIEKEEQFKPWIIR